MNAIHRTGFAALILVSCAPQAPEETLVLTVCPAGAKDKDCGYSGGAGLQAAIDDAADGAVIAIRRGDYFFTTASDVQFAAHDEDETLDIVLPAGLKIEGKSLNLRGEPGVRISGEDSGPMTAVAVKHARVRISDVAFEDFHAGDPEDDRYDGHGVFAVNSDVMLERVTVDGMEKMGVSARGDFVLLIADSRIVNSHLGVWAEETSNVSVRNTLIDNIETAGVGAYDDATVKLYNCVIARSHDDGLYTRQSASIIVTDSVLFGNAPYAARAVDRSRIVVRYSLAIENESDAFADPDSVTRYDNPIAFDEAPENADLSAFLSVNAKGDPNGYTASLGENAIGLFHAHSIASDSVH